MCAKHSLKPANTEEQTTEGEENIDFSTAGLSGARAFNHDGLAFYSASLVTDSAYC